MTVALIACADDYALNPAVDEAILALIDAGRLSATSCMTLSPRWSEAARALGPARRAAADIGLHLDLTAFDSPELPARPLGRVILRSLLRAWPRERLMRHLQRQFDAFEAALGVPPDHVDGHQHIQQLPQLRELLAELLARRYPAGAMPWLRVSRIAASPGLKPRVISALGAGPFARAQRGPLSRRVLGSHGFDLGPVDYARAMDRWLAAARSGDVLMVHPATRAEPGDSIGPARVIEHAHLAGSFFPAALRRHGCVLARGHLALATGRFR